MSRRLAPGFYFPFDVDLKEIGGQEQFVVNPSFESGDVSWTKESGYTIVDDIANARSGSWTAKFVGAGASAAIRCTGKRFRALSGQKFYVEGWIKGGTVGSARVRISWMNAAFGEIGTGPGSTIAAAAASHQKSFGVVAAPAGTIYGQVEFEAFGSPTGTWYMDDAAISRVGAITNDAGVDVSTLRAFGAKYGKYAAVEQGVTNLYTQANFESASVGLGGYNATNGHRPQDVTVQPGGWRRVPKNDLLSGAVNTEIFVSVSVSAAAGERYSFVAHFRTNGPVTWVDGTGIVYFATGGSNTSGNAVITDLGNGVFRIAGTGVANAGVTALRVSLFPTWGVGASYVEIIDWMFFANTGTIDTITEPVYSSHVWGTRGNGALKYPGSVLPLVAGTISCWIRPNYNFTNFATADYHGIVTATTVHASDQMQLWIHGIAGAPLRFEAYAAAAQQFSLSYTPSSWDPSRLHHVAITWSATEQVLYYDGVRRASRSGDFTRWTATTWVTVGTASDPSSPNDYLEGGIDDLAILDRQLTDAQIASLFALGGSFQGETGLGAVGVQSEFVHLVFAQYSNGVVRLNTGAVDLDWDGQTWEAVGGNLKIGGVEESIDFGAQGIELTMSGIDQSIVAVLLTNIFRGRTVRVWRAYLDASTGKVQPEPLLLLEGLQLDPYEITEERERTGGTVSVKTRVRGRMSLDRLRGIWANLTSHQHVFSGDTFFQNAAALANTPVYWGTSPVPIGGGGGGTHSDGRGREDDRNDREDQAF